MQEISNSSNQQAMASISTFAVMFDWNVVLAGGSFGKNSLKTVFILAQSFRS
jgi:hypothetical protein